MLLFSALKSRCQEDGPINRTRGNRPQETRHRMFHTNMRKNLLTVRVGLDLMISRVPFQSLQFCNSVMIQWFAIFMEIKYIFQKGIKTKIQNF